MDTAGMRNDINASVEKKQVGTIDLTPDGLKTPEGAKRVNKAIERLEAAIRNYAHVASRLFSYADMQDRISDLADRDDLAELRDAKGEWDKASEAFLMALIGR